MRRGLGVRGWWVAVGVVLVVVPGVAWASTGRPARAGSMGFSTHGSMLLRQTPAGLQMAVRRALGTGMIPEAGGADRERPQLTASDAAQGEYFGWSVAVWQNIALTAPDGADNDDFG